MGEAVGEWYIASCIPLAWYSGSLVVFVGVMDRLCAETIDVSSISSNACHILNSISNRVCTEPYIQGTDRRPYVPGSWIGLYACFEIPGGW